MSWNADGETVVESYTITDMAHGTPLGIGDNDKRYGAQGAFLIEAGISSSDHIANFFGPAEWIRRPEGASNEAAKPAPRPAPKQTARTLPEGASGPRRGPALAPGWWPPPTPPP